VNAGNMSSDEHRPWSLVGRFASLSAWAGLLGGMLEAVYLLKYPLTPCLLKPSINYVILFLAPLVDGAVAGLAGLGFGLVITTASGQYAARWLLQAVRTYWAVVLTSAISLLGVVAAKALLGGSRAFHLLLELGVILILGSIAYILGKSFSLRILSVTLGIIFALLLACLGIYCLRPSFLATAAAAGPEASAGKPNIILITLDTVRADHLSLYGYSRATTPNLDKWAQQGVVFENAIAPSSWTLASHASMFTGLLPHQHGADRVNPWDRSRWTLAEVLRSWGYATAGFTSNLYYGEGGWGMDQGFDLYDDDSTSVRHNLRALIFGEKVLQPLYDRWMRPDYFDRRNAREINQDVVRWLEHAAPRPYFLFINYFDAHDPYFTPHPHAAAFGDAPAAVIKETQSAYMTESTAHLSAPMRASLVASYDYCLAFLDETVGELLDSLARLPGWEKTIVIITSDHGEAIGEHDTYGHGRTLYREVLRVPLIILGPTIPRDVRIAHLAETRQLFSTVLRFGGKDDLTFRRTSLQRFWTPGYQTVESDGSAISEATLGFRSQGDAAIVSLSSEGWHYLRRSGGEEELFDLTKDPGEQVNLAQSPESMSTVEELRGRLRSTAAASLHPWPRPQYLSALDGPQRPFVNYAASLARSVFGSPGPSPEAGEAQADLPPKASRASQRPHKADEDLIRSLPYH
jgi:arylsulfatase A-like enzyme